MEVDSVGRERRSFHLPNEILLHIISLLDKDTVLSAVSVNHLFSAEIERSLYRDIHISVSPKGRNRRDDILKSALRANPQRASYTRSLSITVDHASISNIASQVPLMTFSSVQSLTILPSALGGSVNAASAPAVFSQCFFPQLTYFRSIWSLNDPSFRTFLSKHSSLTSIVVGKSFSTFSLPTSFPPNILPRLHSLDGHWSNVVRLVKGRPVKNVSMKSANMSSYLPRHRLSVILPIIAQNTKGANRIYERDEMGVTRLSVHVRDGAEEMARLVAEYLPGLRCLELVHCPQAAGSNAEEEVESFSWFIGDGSGLGDAIGRFEALEELEIDQGTGVRPSVSLPQRSVDMIGARTPSLRRIRAGRQVWLRRTRIDDWVLKV